MRPVTWVLISDDSRARLFEATMGQTNELKDLVQLEGRRPGPGAPEAREEKAEEEFTRHLAAVLRQGLIAGRYTSLVLIAPQHHLDLLRLALEPQVEGRVTAALCRDYVGLATKELHLRLQHLLSHMPKDPPRMGNDSSHGSPADL